MSRARLAQLAGAVAALVLAPSALACPGGYSYAGLYAPAPAAGIGASLSMLDSPTVAGGHVAAWVGVGGPGLGPHGSDEWLQVGLASFDSPAGRLYYELALPGQQPRYVELASRIAPGQSVRVAVMELPLAREEWIVITPSGIAGPFHLPRSHAAWAPIATAESWARGGSYCNDFAYRFAGVELAHAGGAWSSLRHASKLQDPGWRVHRLSRSSFSATSA
ncbi:MAG: hypothetical protein ACXVFC_08800 [Gaiellaceae bacterium]